MSRSFTLGIYYQISLYHCLPCSRILESMDFCYTYCVP